LRRAVSAADKPGGTRLLPLPRFPRRERLDSRLLADTGTRLRCL